MCVSAENISKQTANIIDKKHFKLFSDEKSIVLAVVIGVVVPVAVIAIVVVFLVCFLTRPRHGESKSQSDRKSVDPTFCRPVPLADFTKHVERMAKDSGLEFSNEYEVSIRYTFRCTSLTSIFAQPFTVEKDKQIA
jgi:hypothetical protein